MSNAARSDHGRGPIPGVAVPEPGQSLECVTLATARSVLVRVTATGDRVLVEHSQIDEGSGRRWVYLVRQFDRADPGLRAELARLRPKA